MTTFDDLIAKAQFRTLKVSLCLRGDLLDEHERAKNDLAIAEVQGVVGDRLVELAESVLAIEADVREASIEMVLRSIGRRAWSDLLAKFPPTDEQRKKFGRRLDHDPETFPYEALAASIVEPEGVTAEKLRDLEEVLTSSQWDEMWVGCLSLNVGPQHLGESKAASDVLRRSRPSSELPAPTAPAAASSPDES